LHPAKFPEELINFFLSAFTEPGDILLDPMGGTASAGVAALSAGRIPVIIELNDKWAVICRERMKASGNLFGGDPSPGVLIEGDARDVLQLVPENLLPVRYTITSPPYWRILHSNGMHVNDEGQKARRAKGLATVYSDNERDFGNITSYGRFVEELAAIYEDVARLMPRGSLLTFVTKNIKYERAIYTIAWDLVFRLCRKNGGKFEYAGNTFWCQDDVGLKPFGMGCDWISNILHQYCIHMRVR
jgi:DNA modification methylase